jgi:hypothetical protein
MDSSGVVLNVKEPERMSLANSRDRLVLPMNPAYSKVGGRTLDRLPPPMKTPLQMRPETTSTVKK